MYLTNFGQALTIGAAASLSWRTRRFWSTPWCPLLRRPHGVSPGAGGPDAALARTPTELTATNVVSSTIDSLGLFVGPAIGGVLLALSSVGMVFLATAVMAIVSALILPGWRARRRRFAASSEGKFKAAFAGFGSFLAIPQLRVLEVLSGGQAFVAGAFNVLIVVSALELLDVGSEGGVGALTPLSASAV